ncbi:MAG TPA: hypothetical protein VK644_06220 [Chitinophagaceae bacterium]|nr:hypothetical protein [Chitinophagaceae bacterium]
MRYTCLFIALVLLASMTSLAAPWQFQQQKGDTLQERMYVHTDKNFYVAGEIVWFKVYGVKATDCQPTNLSKIAYVEIIDREGKPVVQGKVRLGPKGGDGSFYLPLSIASDNYRLRAYTRYMKNDGPGIFFEKAVTILNTIKPGTPGSTEPAGIKAAFFPEGGQLVKDIESRVAFHVTDEYGKGINVDGVLVDEAGDTITHFSSHRLGMGSFLLKPKPGDHYMAIVRGPGTTSVTVPMPATGESGFVLNVTDNKDSRWKIRVLGQGTDPASRGENVFLLASTRKILRKAIEGFLAYEGELTLYLDKSALGEGVSQLTLFNKDHQAVSERLVFTRPQTETQLNLHSDKEAYAAREPVQLSALLGKEIAQDQHASYSLSVFQQDSLQGNDDAGIDSYLWLSSDLHGEVESPGFYFSEDPEVPSATDELLLTHGWRRFNTPGVSAHDGEMSTVAIPELRGHLVAAKITRVTDGMPGIDVTCYLSCPSRPFGLYTTLSDSTGMAYFTVNDFYGPGEIIVQTDKTNNIAYRSDVLTPFWGKYNAEEWSRPLLRKEYEEMLTQRSIAMQAQNIYEADSIRRFDAPVLKDTLAFFGKPEYSYPLDDYKRFTTMEEVLREFVVSVSVVPHNGKLTMRIYDEAYKNLFTDNLLVMIDGVPLMDYNQLFKYDPLKIKKLDVVPRRYQLGPASFSGIVSAETYQGQFTAFELDPSIIAVDYEDLQLHRQFYAPEYKPGERKTHLPDLRTTLYWAPDLSPDKEGRGNLQFFTSDQKGKFHVVLQGINSEGKPVSASTEFSVK